MNATVYPIPSDEMTGASAPPSGSRPTDGAQEVSTLTGFDPSRVMVPYGPDHPDYPNAPQDWDGGPYLCRDGQLYHMRGYGWKHGLGCWNPTADWDRVAYHSASAIEARSDATGTGAAEGESATAESGDAR